MNKPAPLPAQNYDEVETAEHAAWLREEIEAALKAKAEGKLSYKSVNAVAAKFGVNAR